MVGDAAWIVEPEDVEDICDALLKLHSEPKSRAALVQKGLAHSREFSWERAARETLAVYRSAVLNAARHVPGTIHTLDSVPVPRD